MGGFAVYAMLTGTDQIGAGPLNAIIVTATVLTSMWMDHFGFMGVKQHAFNIWRGVGCVLMVAPASASLPSSNGAFFESRSPVDKPGRTLLRAFLDVTNHNQNRRENMPNNEDVKGSTEQGKERGYRVRQVTHYQPSWKEKEQGQPGGFYIQLILDHGVDEYILEPEVRDADLLLKLLALGGYVGFDLDRKVLMFPNSSTK